MPSSHDISDAMAISFGIFGSLTPPFTKCPHLLTTLTSDSVSAIIEVTTSRPGIWLDSPPYNRTGSSNDEAGPFSLWEAEPNQRYLLELCGKYQGYFATNPRLFIDAHVNESMVQSVLHHQVEKDPVEDWEELWKLLQIVQWLAIPVVEASYLLFVCPFAHQPWINDLITLLHSNSKQWARFLPFANQLALEGSLLNNEVDPAWKATVQLILEGVTDIRKWPVAHRQAQYAEEGVRDTSR